MEAAAAARTAGGLAELGEALGRSEGTLRGALAELRAELRALEGGVERRVAEAMHVAGPLAQAVAELQREQRELRAQVTRLAEQLEVLLGTSENPPAAAPRFASHARFALAGAGSQSVDLGDLNDAEGKSPPDPGTIENGFHQPPGGPNRQSQETSPPPSSEAPLEAHAPAVSLRKPHLPVTAVTKVSETFSGETVGLPVPSQRPGGQQNEVASTVLSQTGSVVKNWSTSTLRTASASVTAVSKSTSSASYGSQASERVTISQSQQDTTLKPQSPPATLHRQAEKRRELVRSQTLPRAVGTQGRKALFEKFEQESIKGRPKLKRSQSFGVASASSIKQILLEWCRSKTVGYKHVDLQNFSSSWSDGMAFCALVHAFFPEAFDYHTLDPAKRKENFELAFTTAEKMANCDRLIEVEDMLLMGRKPDPMCVFTYVQSLYNHLRRFE